MKKYNLILMIAVVALSFIGLPGCPNIQTNQQPAVPPNPAFFKDSVPDQGPWQIRVSGDKGSYQKLYVHRKENAMIAATFARVEEQVNVDLTDPRNQKALAEGALQGFCKGIEAKCLVESSDLAWIVGTPMQYIYVRFSAERKGTEQLRGLIYYRFDQPFQTMYLLLTDTKVFDGFETAFLNYLSQAEFHPEQFR